ncbi:MAG: cyclomaltodextrin glucanotransferase [Gammaproteobacteria bacterium]|nr:MAG: cyclomaltodextrin glucanotransferase [Gammaproteobacteria bacterium]
MVAVVIATTQGCAVTTKPDASSSFYGTLEPLASDAIYFVVTDRFVNGDPSNDQRDQGGAHHTFDVPTPGAPAGESDNIGYLGGDFKGVLDNADYIRGLGFGAVWITPITDNPDEAFTGGDPVSWGSGLTDRGKTGYHGYWSNNFYQLDEHLPSAGLDFAAYTRKMREHGLKTVLDIVANHGGPAWTMPVTQPKFGQIFDGEGKLKLDPKHNPLHAFYKTKPILAQLSNIDENSAAALDYFVGAYEQWIDQGADAFRIDAIGLTPTTYWKKFAARIRARHPGFFMYGENFEFDANKIAPYTRAEGGAISVLDFPLKKQLQATFEHAGSDYAAIAPALFLEKGPYRNPYELVTFYDNHDMARLNASDNGFIDAHNFLFTARGIPVIYYGSEIGFMRGRPEHAGNRNYFGQERVDAATRSPICRELKPIANLRRESIALQRGLQLDVAFKGDTAVFYRVYENAGTAQTALVLLNKGDTAQTIDVREWLQPGTWRDAFGEQQIEVGDHLAIAVPAHGVRVYFYDQPLTRADLRTRLARAMADKERAD